MSSRKAGVCDAAAESLSKLGTCISIPSDLSTSNGRDHFINTIKEREPSIDVIVNNAAAAWRTPFEEQIETAYDKILDINVKSMFFVIQGLLPLLKKSAPEDPSRIINIGFIDGLHISKMNTLPYGVSKAAIHHISKSISGKSAENYNTVNVIAPGPFESKTRESLLQSPIRKIVEQSCLMKRIGHPAGTTVLVLFLSS